MSAGERSAGTTLGNHRRRLVPSLLGAVALTLVLGTARATVPTVAAADDDCPIGSVGCFPRMALGLSTPGLPGTTAALYALESAVDHKADIALTFTSFRYAFDATNLRAVALTGAMPMVTWEPFDATVPEENRYPLRDLAAGANDTYLRAQAARIKAVGKPVALRFAHEMNASFYPWGAGVNGNTPADYVAAYRHVHDVFAQEDVHNVTWVWSPAALDTPNAPDLSPFYPGDDYVDWAGLSVYYDQPTDTWANTVEPTLRQLDTAAPDAPIYFAEAGVLPGDNRPTMIHELLGGLLRTPRAIGFTWFNFLSREDWRIDADLPALAAMREEIGVDWYDSAAVTAGLAPLLQVAPGLGGSPQVGASLTATDGSWRGATATTGRWLLCADASTATCRPAEASGPTFTLTPATVGQLVRYEVVATGVGGSTTASSAPSESVLPVPTPPARPVVEARSGGARVVFPAVPPGTTHWRLRLDGAALHLVAGTTADYWLTGLANGTVHTLSLAAVAVSSTATVESPTTSGTFTPMKQQFNPYVSVTGPTASFTMPTAPAGAEGWVLTVNGVAQTVALTTRSISVPGLPLGRPLSWSLAAGAGTWEGVAYGALTPPSTGAFTALATPAAPVVTPGSGSITLTMPTAPAGATGWRVSVGATTYPDLTLASTTFTASGLYPGFPSTWTLRATTSTSRSLPLTGTAAALSAAQ
ncbi:glycosyl hydrolase [Pengzhenrongella frigida]|uniref:GH26 domain-containing protein n=1 Tax=Pengzhenrongella frigida TaxID=1259133 RepID=A0A4Q5MWL9_9MICO|nr:glycosyl hydrolase [Cellulomonas sp. HLT2-17]RYV49955.1 hypothetical protein EUA98_16105 [Cellulomonas sp. HLT2-17]